MILWCWINNLFYKVKSVCFKNIPNAFFWFYSWQGWRHWPDDSSLSVFACQSRCWLGVTFLGTARLESYRRAQCVTWHCLVATFLSIIWQWELAMKTRYISTAAVSLFNVYGWFTSWNLSEAEREPTPWRVQHSSYNFVLLFFSFPSLTCFATHFFIVPETDSCSIERRGPLTKFRRRTR